MEPSATTTPVTIVVTCGVRYFGCTRRNQGGSSPSRLMEKKMRGWPSWNTSSTAVMEITAPREMMAWPQVMPATSKALRQRDRSP